MTSYASDGGKGSKKRPTRLSYRLQDIRHVLANGNGNKGRMEIRMDEIEHLDEESYRAILASPHFIIQLSI